MLSILVFGAGAIGGYLGGSLALQGHRVVFLERPYNAPILRERGLHLQLGQHNHHIHPLEVVTELESAFQPSTLNIKQSSFDLALFALKSYHTQGARRPPTPPPRPREFAPDRASSFHPSP